MIKTIKKVLKVLCFYFFPNNLSFEVQLETTSYCNASCSFCPNPTLKRTKCFMSDETFNFLLRKLQNEKIKIERFILHLNGEPLTDPNLFERITKIKTVFPYAEVRFTTNFGLADQEKRQKILSCGVDEVTISINSLDEDEYKNIMGLDLRTTLANVESFVLMRSEKNSNIKINFSIVARESNIKMVEEFKRKYGTIGNIRVIQLGQWVGKDKPDDYNSSIKSQKRVCPILWHTINVLSNGEYSLCCFDAEGIINKSIYDGSIMKTWRSGYFQKLRWLHLFKGRINKECINCSFR